MARRGERESSGSGDRPADESGWGFSSAYPDETPETAGDEPPAGPSGGHKPSRTRERGVMSPVRAGRSFVETLLMRLVATAGIVGIGVAIAAIMASQKSQGWMIGLVVSAVSVILAAVLWSSRRL